METVWRVGTRQSRLAQIQTDRVIAQLHALFPQISCKKIFISTKGDEDQTTSLLKLGGQGIFVKKIQQALLTGEIDFAVHSAKDLPSVESAELTLIAFPERAAVSDCLLTMKQQTLDTLPQGARVGTSSLRRQFQLRKARPDFELASLRGNIDTRLEKLVAGEYDAIVMAKAGLDRYNLQLDARGITANELPIPAFLPAVGQGAIAVECIAGAPLADYLAKLDQPDVRRVITCERAFLAVFGVGCNIPIAAYGQLANDKITLQTMLGGRCNRSYHLTVTGVDPVELGQAAAFELKRQANL